MSQQTKTQVSTNVVYEHLENSDKRFVVEQGGSRSGKTYNILIWIIFSYCAKHQGKLISVIRGSSTSLDRSVYRDFQKILLEYGLYDERFHNKTRREYRLNKNTIEFFSLDDPQKVRGGTRDLAFLNEANELSWEDFTQIAMRTSDRVIVDFNPSMVFHWIYEQLIPRKNEDGTPEVDFYQTTYKDNPYLSKSVVMEIESYKVTDPDRWRVYGLGERAILQDVIYTNWDRVSVIPEDAKFSGYGLDFGYTAPTAMLGVWEMDGNLYIKQMLYEEGLTVEKLSDRLEGMGVNKQDLICADSAEPKSIASLRDRGYNVFGTIKGGDSIRHGIDLLKSKKLYITEDSTDLLKEIQMYKWKLDKDGNNLGVPVKAWDHALDALRYWALENIKRKNYGKYYFK